jgi:thiol-disulfide isomerase/thioredoxin
MSYYSEVLKKPVTDSSLIKDGSFFFTGELTIPAVATLRLQNKDAYTFENTALIFIEPTNMSITLDGNAMSDVVLTGSFSQRVYDTLKLLQKKLKVDYKDMLDSIEKSGEPVTDKRLLKNKEELKLKFRTLDTAFMMARPNSIVTAFFLQSYFRILPKERILHYYNTMGQKLQNSIYGKQVSDVIERMSRASIGDMASDFERVDVRSDKISLNQLRGKYVLLDFWASWCVPCREESPHLITLYKKYHKRGLEIISIADDDSRVQAWKEAINKDAIGDWHHILRGSDREKAMNGIFNPGDLSDLYGVASLPTKILIDKKGKIIYNSRYRNDFDLDETLKNIFEK